MTLIPAQRGPRRYARPGMALSPREVEVLALVADGASYHEIAGQLGISIDTVKSHLQKIFAKLGAKNGPHAVTIAIGQQAIYPQTLVDSGLYAGQAVVGE